MLLPKAEYTAMLLGATGKVGGLIVHLLGPHLKRWQSSVITVGARPCSEPRVGVLQPLRATDRRLETAGRAAYEHRLDWTYARSVERWSAWEHEGLSDVREGEARPW
jgi:hypothetical protein